MRPKHEEKAPRRADCITLIKNQSRVLHPFVKHHKALGNAAKEAVGPLSFFFSSVIASSACCDAVDVQTFKWKYRVGLGRSVALGDASSQLRQQYRL